MTIKELFAGAEGGVLTYEQFEALTKENGIKLADLSEGKYVSKSKYEADLKAKDTELENVNSQIETLNGTIATRDKDLEGLQKQLEAAGKDATKIAELNDTITGLQSKYDADREKYDADIKSYQDKLQKQSYEFAVKEFANTKHFSSQAAKRDFVQSMIARGLQMEGDKILGREDFAEKYAEENADAFYVEQPKVEPKSQEPVVEDMKVDIPQFVAPTPGASTGTESAEFDFGFTGVRAH